MSDLLYKIALSLIHSVGPITAKQIVSYCGGPEAVFRQTRRSLLKIPGIGPKTVDEIKNPIVMEKAQTELDFMTKHQLKSYFYLDDTYPSRLKAFDDSPVMLYFQGKDYLNHSRTVGIVGTRKPTERARILCESIIDDLKSYDPLIVSGLAYGVDAIAHRRSIEAGIPTIGVMGNGLGLTYPASHRGLRDRMLGKGGVITEFPFRTKPEREHFPMRNRIIAALSDAVLVVESARKGGSMITAKFAFSYNKDVFAIPGRPGDELSAGPNFLIKSNVAGLVESGDDIASKMLWEKEKRAKSKQLLLFDQLNEKEKLVVSLIQKSGELSPGIDSIHYASGMPLSELSGLILSLELKNIVVGLPGSRYRLVR